MNGIDSIIIVAGVSCVGKTTFLKKLQSASPPHLPADLHAVNLSSFTVMNAMDLMTSSATDACPQRIILHYDLFRPITFYDALTFDVDPVLNIVQRARDRIVITMWEDPAILHKRSTRRRRALWRKVARRSSFNKLLANVAEYRGARMRRNRMRSWFASRWRLWQLYDLWFDFISVAGLEKHWIVRPSHDMTFIPLGRGRPSAPLWPVSLDGPGFD